MPKPKLNLLGQKFAHMLVIGDRGSDGHHTLWKVRCDCGRVVIKVGVEIKSGKFCCAKCPFLRESIGAHNATHAMSRHPAYAVWRSMLARCNRPSHPAFKNYGGRGIHVCDAWMKFETFWGDLRDGYMPGLTLDRIDNNAGYCRENCRWASMTTQCRNKRSNVLIPTPLGQLTVAEASERFGVGRTTIFYRIQNHWPADKLLVEPAPTNRIFL